MKTITKIRREVAILANRINKKVKDLSAAFKRAWTIIKGCQLISKISGVTIGNRQKALNRLQRYTVEDINVTLEREPDNQYDPNAVKVMVSVGSGAKYHLGFIPKDLAALLAPLLDKGIKLITKFKGTTGGTEDKFYYGGLLEIQL